MFEVYRINEGDTIQSIADNYRVSLDYLYKLNGLDWERNIMVGDSIVVPKLISNYFDYYTIKKGMTLDNFAKENNVNSDLLSNLNGLNKYDYFYPNQVIVMPKSDVSFYITSSNDTLEDIVKKMKVPVMDLINQNKKLYLEEGQVVVYKEK